MKPEKNTVADEEGPKRIFQKGLGLGVCDSGDKSLGFRD